MIYSTEYCAWLSMLWCFIWQGIPLMKWFEPHKNRQKPARILDPGSAVFAGSLAFFKNFGLIKDQIESDLKGDINAISYNRNKWYIFLILARISNQIKRWLGSWHMSASWLSVGLFIPQCPFRRAIGPCQVWSGPPRTESPFSLRRIYFLSETDLFLAYYGLRCPAEPQGTRSPPKNKNSSDLSNYFGKEPHFRNKKSYLQPSRVAPYPPPFAYVPRTQQNYIVF